MPCDYSKYPADWKAIVVRIKARAGDRCECQGECGLHREHPGPRRCTEVNGQPAKWAKGKIILTVAHLDHDTTNNDETNLKALCQRCHNRYDQPHRQANAAATRAKQQSDLQTLVQRAINRLIGTCHTCSKYEECQTPKIRDENPYEGCARWKNSMP